MKYKVHKFPVERSVDSITLERFLNGIEGHIISIIPNIIPKFHMMGATAGFNYLLIIERIE